MRLGGRIQNKMDVVAALQFLKLNQVPQGWVDGAWDLEFADRHPMDDPIEDQLAASSSGDFHTLYRCLLPFTAPPELPGDSDAPSQNLWAVLRDNGWSVSSLVAVLSHFILTGKAKNADTQQRVRGLNAAAVYLLLLGVPGSVINMVFHEILLDTCTDMTRHCWPKDGGKKRKRDGVPSSQTTGKRSKPPRRKGKVTPAEEEEDEEEEEEPLFFSSQDLKEIRDSVLLLVRSLLRFVHTFPLKDRPQRSTLVQIFIKLLYFEPAPSDVTLDPPRDVTELATVPELAFHGLRLLVSPKHGDPERSLQRVFSWILYPILLMEKAEWGRPSLLAPCQAALATRDHAITFVWRLVDEMKDLALPFLQILLQHLCFEMVEKSEYRVHGARAVGRLTSPMEAADYARFVKWLLDLSRGKKMLGRLFSADVALVLLEQPERNPEDCEDLDLVYFLSHEFLVQNVLFDRTSDVSPTVQSHVLACLAQCLELESLNATRAMHRLFNTAESHTVLEAETPGGSSHETPRPKCTSTPFRTLAISSPYAYQCNAKENLALVMRRVSDVKVTVRKAALQSVLSLLKHDVIPASLENVRVMSERSRDLSVSMKKKALQCLGELLSLKACCEAVQRAWLDGVLQAVMDDEDSVQEKALDQLDLVLVSEVRPYQEGRPLEAGQRLAWSLLGLLTQQCTHLRKHLSRVFTLWSRQNKFTRKFITDVISHTDGPHAASAWMLLSKVPWTFPKLHYGKILDAWNAMDSPAAGSSQSDCHIMRVVGNVAKHMDEETKNKIVADVMSRLKTFSLSLDVISAAVQLLYRLGPQRDQDIKKTQAFLNQHCGELVSLSEAHLASILLKKQGTQNLNVDLMIKHLHTLGVASLRCPSRITKRTVLVVESVLASPSDQLTESPEELPASLALSQFQPNPLPTKVRATGVLALGKLCLQHEDLARKYLPVFARELEVGGEAAVRHAVVMAMCDLCVRYTNLVDNYIPNVSACLRDGDAAVRQQALQSLTHLLREEYVKWRGSLFFRFTVLLVDPVPAIASLCEAVLRMVLKRNPEMFSQHFVESIFFLNAFDKHRTYNRFPHTDREKTRFSLRGTQQRENRFRIYRFLLEHFTDAQRFNVTMRLNNTVLACFADGELQLDSDGADILSDTFRILSLKEMRLQVASSAEEEVEEEEDWISSSSTFARTTSTSSTSTRASTTSTSRVNSSRATLASAQKRVVLQVHKKAFVENTVPLILSLKRLLEKKRSPALGDLYAFLQEKMKDYRSEMKEVLREDEQLAAELEYSLNLAEREHTQREKTVEELDSLYFSIVPRKKMNKS